MLVMTSAVLLVGKKGRLHCKTAGTREFPWRVFGIARNEWPISLKMILFTVWAVPANSRKHPGSNRVRWHGDWWNDWNISGVPFKSGINTDTYKYLYRLRF